MTGRRRRERNGPGPPIYPDARRDRSQPSSPVMGDSGQPAVPRPFCPGPAPRRQRVAGRSAGAAAPLNPGRLPALLPVVHRLLVRRASRRMLPQNYRDHEMPDRAAWVPPAVRANVSARWRSRAQSSRGRGAGTPGRPRGTRTRRTSGRIVQDTGVGISTDSPSIPPRADQPRGRPPAAPARPRRRWRRVGGSDCSLIPCSPPAPPASCGGRRPARPPHRARPCMPPAGSPGYITPSVTGRTSL